MQISVTHDIAANWKDVFTANIRDVALDPVFDAIYNPTPVKFKNFRPII